MTKYREILKNKNFLFLWLGQIISQWGDRLGQMALIAFIYERSPGSSWALAKILSLTILPVFLIGPVAGVYVDRWDRRRTMCISDLLRAGLFVIIPLWFVYFKSLIPLYAVIFLVFTIGRFFVPAKMAIIPDLVKKEDLLAANSLVNIAALIAALLGLGIGGVLVERWGSRGGFHLDAMSFLFSAVLIFFISTPGLLTKKKKDGRLGLEFVETISRSVFTEIKEGLIYLFKLKEAVFTAKLLFVLWSALGSVYVVIIVFVQETLKSSTKYLGILSLFLVAGLILGSLLYGKLGKKVSLNKTLFFSLALTGLSLISFALVLKYSANFTSAALLSFLLGLVISPIIVIANTLVHQASSEQMRGKVFSSIEIVCHLAFIIFMIISAKLAEYVHQFWILISVGAIIFLFSIFNIIFKDDIKWQD